MKKVLAGMAAAAALAAGAAENAIETIPAEVNGRKVEAFWQGSKREWKCATTQKDLFLVQHPATKHAGKKNMPLYVVLHSAGHNVMSCINCTKQKGNHDIYHSPEDFYALYLDCRANERTDWWWGIAKYKGWELSPCERRVMETVEWTIEKYGIDRDRVYLCGNSMGGSGTLGIGMRHGDVFAAIKANVPAGVGHALDRMGLGKGGAPAGWKLPDPPVLVDYSAPNDTWSKGHDEFIAALQANKYAGMFFWAAFGHANNHELIARKNDIIHSFDWLKVKKSEPYPVFTGASSDDKAPWPDDLKSTKAGQINGYFRWANAKAGEKELTVELRVASAEELGSKIFTPPAEATATVTMRRTGKFAVAAGETVKWEFGGARGEAKAGADGLASVEGLKIGTAAKTLRLYK